MFFLEILIGFFIRNSAGTERKLINKRFLFELNLKINDKQLIKKLIMSLQFQMTQKKPKRRQITFFMAGGREYLH